MTLSPSSRSPIGINNAFNFLWDLSRGDPQVVNAPKGVEMKRLIPVSIWIILFAGAARAEFVTSLPESIVIPMPPMNYFGGGPQVFDGVTWTSTNLNTFDGSAFG